jgi:hypothetical protein
MTMKLISNKTIEEGAHLLDVGNWDEFTEFISEHVTDLTVRIAVRDGLKTLIDVGQRPRAIELWRKMMASTNEVVKRGTFYSMTILVASPLEPHQVRAHALAALEEKFSIVRCDDPKVYR